MNDLINKSSSKEVQAGLVSQQAMADGDIDLRELFAEIWAGKWLIIAITAVFSIASGIYAINQPNIYKAQALLAPASSDSSGGLSAMSRQFGGLASLAGINIGGGSNTDKTVLAIEVMQSRKFITDFIQKYNLLVPLMAAKGWDEATNELIIDLGLYNVETNEWLRESESGATLEPTMWEAHKAFREILSVSQTKDNGLVTLSVESLSPQIAKQWVEWLVKEINLNIKTKDLQEAKSSIKYLNFQLDNTQVTQMQNVFYQLIEEQTKTIMLSEVRDEYVFLTIDPAVVPEDRVSPKRFIIFILGVTLGGVLGTLIILTRYFLVK